MNIFSRKAKQPIIKPDPQPETVKPLVPDPEDQPFETVAPPTQVHPEFMQKCASCPNIGATNHLKVSYFGYLELNVMICDFCATQLAEKKQQHNVDMHRKPIAAKETVEVAALKKIRLRQNAPAMNGGMVKPGIALVADTAPEIIFTLDGKEMRTPSRPLEDRAHNLALEA